MRSDVRAFREMSDWQYERIVQCERDAWERFRLEGLPWDGVLDTFIARMQAFAKQTWDATPYALAVKAQYIFAGLFAEAREAGTRWAHPFDGVNWEADGIHPKWFFSPGILLRREHRVKEG